MTDGEIHGETFIPFTVEYRRNHDRLQRSNYLNLGGGVNFAVTNSLEIFHAAAKMVWGENVHPLRGVSLGLNFHFGVHAGGRRPQS